MPWNEDNTRLPMLRVTDEQMFDQLAEGSATDGDHLIWIDSEMLVLTEDGPRSPQQANWYLDVREWAPTYSLCGEKECLRLDHLTDSQAKAAARRDEEILQLVERNSFTLASLYRKGKARGLLSSRSAYH